MAQESLIGRRCERAVLTAYRELRQVGSDDMSAFQACTTLYRIHHPEASIHEARLLVAGKPVDLLRSDSLLTLNFPSILDHEVVAIDI